MAVRSDVARAIGARPLLALAVALVAALAWRVNPWTLGLVLPFLPFRTGWPFIGFGLFVGALLAPASAPLLLEREAFRGEVTVASVPRIRVDRIDFEAATDGHRWAARIPGRHSEVRFGDRLGVQGSLRPLREGSDDYARLQGIEARLEVRSWTLTASGPQIARWADQWRRSFASFCESNLPADIAALTEALCLNLDGTLDDATRDRLRATGTIHIVSASGLHVFVLAWALMALLSQFPFPRPLQILILALLLGLYALATGLNAPVVRSVLMSLVGACAYLFRRERDVVSALALAAAAYLLWRPRGVFDIGFQLSFVTVGGLALFAASEWEAPETFLHSVQKTMVEAVRVSWIAFVASAPLVAYHFGTLSLSSLPANLLIALPVSCIVVLGLGAHLMFLLNNLVGLGVLWWVGCLGGYTLIVLEGLGELPYAKVDVPPVPGWVVVALYGALLLTWRERHVHP